MDDFCIPNTPAPDDERDPFDPYDDFANASAVDLSGLGDQSANPRSARAIELDVDTASTIDESGPRRDTHTADNRPYSSKRPLPLSKTFGRGEPMHSTSFPSPLRQRPGLDDRGDRFELSSARHISSSSRSTAGQRPGSQGWDVEPPRASSYAKTTQSGAGDSGYRGIQDAIGAKFRDLEAKIESQDSELTIMRFALNDARIAADTLEMEKRQLRQKADEVGRKLAQRSEQVGKLQEEVRKQAGALERSADDQRRLRDEIARAAANAGRDENALTDAQKLVRELRVQLETTRKESDDLTASMAEKSRQAKETANAKIADLEGQLQMRCKEAQALRDANAQFSKKIEDIPERNFQALTACVKKIIERLEGTKTDILASDKGAKEKAQEQHGTMVQYLKGILSSSQQHLDMLISSREENKAFFEKVSSTVEESNGERRSAEAVCLSRLDTMMATIESQMSTQQASLLDAFAKKCMESDTLASVCSKQETASVNITTRLEDQLALCREQSRQYQDIRQSLERLEAGPREDPALVAKIKFLEQLKRQLESDLKDRDVQIARLEEAYKERTNSVIQTADKFAADVQQLTSSFRRREEEYRRALDAAAKMASEEARRLLDKSREETQAELQQERAKRQSLEKELRQTKEDFSVLEESNRRSLLSYDALQKELASSKLASQAITDHLEEKARTLESHIARDTAAIAKLKATLADRETELTGLRATIEAYYEKVRALTESLRDWAQEHAHVGAIRSRLEMLGKVDQSCVATARVREADQIYGVVTHLRYHYAHPSDQANQAKPPAPSADAESASILSDGQTHEQRISDLSAFLDAEVSNSRAALQESPDGYSIGLPAVSVGSTGPFKTPANDIRRRTSTTKPPPVYNDRTIAVSVGSNPATTSSSPNPETPVQQRPRANQKQGRKTSAPAHIQPARKSSRKRPSGLGEREDTASQAVREPALKRRCSAMSAYFEPEIDDSQDESDAAEAAISTSPPSFIKIEDL